MRYSLRQLTGLLTCLFVATSTAQTSANSSFCISQQVSPGQQQAIWDAFIQEWYIEKADGYINSVFHQYIDANYIQHNTMAPSGAQNNIDFLQNILVGLNVTVYHVSSVEQNIGWIHWRVQGGPQSIFPNKTGIVDVYRFNGSCIVEHWDVIQSVTNTTTNPIALF